MSAFDRAAAARVLADYDDPTRGDILEYRMAVQLRLALAEIDRLSDGIRALVASAEPVAFDRCVLVGDLARLLTPGTLGHVDATQRRLDQAVDGVRQVVASVVEERDAARAERDAYRAMLCELLACHGRVRLGGEFDGELWVRARRLLAEGP